MKVKINDLSNHVDFLNEHNITHNEKNELKKEFKHLTQQGVIKSNFESNIWTLPDKLNYGNNFNLDFKKIKINFKITDLDTIKFWIISLLKEYQSSTVANNFSFFTKMLSLTDFFSEARINSFYNYIYNNFYDSKNTKYMMALTSLNFISFSGIKIDTEYIKIMNKVKSSFYKKLSNQQLPKSKYIINFSYLLERFMEDISLDTTLNNNEKSDLQILYYPLIIWWKLTTILPMRIGEFIHLEKSNIYTKNGRYFIRFRRIKADKRIDQYEINNETYALIENYINLTKNYKVTKYLLSYDAVINVSPTSSRIHQSNNKLFFSRSNFHSILISFYEEIIGTYYNIHIPKTERLRPNDTRHLAIMSLMMQGASPIEIAKYAGHSTIEKQYNYTFHPEYWVDNEVFKLQNKISKDDHNIFKELENIPTTIITKAFTPPTSDFIGELNIGYCSDIEIRCESSKSCLLCSHWRISTEEFITEKQNIIEEIKKIRSNILESVDFIKNTFMQISQSDDDQIISTTLYNSYQPTLEDIRSNVFNLNHLTQIINKGNDIN